MRLFLSRTFGGLNRQYYLRQLVFGALIGAFFFWMRSGIHHVILGPLIYCTVNTLLYPYSRFSYESIVGFVLGQNMLFLPAPIVLGTKLVTMLVCWMMAVVIAPFGLAWLYFHHRRQARAA